MWNVIMIVDGEQYVYGCYNDRNKANEVAMQVRDERGVWVFITEKN